MGLGERGMAMRVLTHKGKGSHSWENGKGGDLGKESQRLWSWQKQMTHSHRGTERKVRPRLLTECRQGIGNARQQQEPKESLSLLGLKGQRDEQFPEPSRAVAFESRQIQLTTSNSKGGAGRISRPTSLSCSPHLPPVSPIARTERAHQCMNPSGLQSKGSSRFGKVNGKYPIKILCLLQG